LTAVLFRRFPRDDRLPWERRADAIGGVLIPPL